MVPNYSNDHKETIIERFKREQKEWKDKIVSLARQMKDVHNLTSFEVDIFSQRQIVLEYVHKLIATAGRINREYKKLLKTKIIFYSDSYDIRLDKSQKILFSEVDLEQKLAQKELIYGHLEYMRSTLDTIDKMIYGLKWRIQIEELKKIRTQ